jgi:uncharacterized protein (TIGR02466 family)
MTDFSLFPVLVRRIENFLNDDECEEIILLSKKINLFEHSLITNKSKSSYTMHSNTHIEINNIISNFKEKLLNEVKLYCDKSGLKIYDDISNSWINIQTKNSILKMHKHQLSTISGVLYLKVNEDSSKLYFQNPNPYIEMCYTNNLTDYTTEKFWIKPNIGDLILFPSWLSHGSNEEKNMSEERIVFGFNIK